MKALVLLAGCGLGDGSCIEEVVLTYLAMEKRQWTYQPAAHAMEMPAVNHISEQQEGTRNVLIESARIGRGRVKELNAVCAEDFDCLVIPGGMGLLGNYKNDESVRKLVLSFSEQHKPIAAMCAGIYFLRYILGEDLLREECKTLHANGFCCDKKRNVYYTPAFGKAGNLCDVQQGIDCMIGKLDSCNQK